MATVLVQMPGKEAFEVDRCISINDVKVRVANKLRRFAPEIIVTEIENSGLLLDHERIPRSRIVYAHLSLPPDGGDSAFWHESMRSHAYAGDQSGTNRSIAQLKKSGHNRRMVVTTVLSEHHAAKRRSQTRYAFAKEEDKKVEELEKSPRFEHILRYIGAEDDLKMMKKDPKFRGEDYFHAIKRNDLVMIEKLIKTREDVNLLDEKRATPLHVAVRHERFACLLALLRARASVNEIDVHHNTPLILACKYNYTDIGKKLLGNRADANIKNENNLTPLLWAASNANADMLKCLILVAADVAWTNNEGNTALHLAAATGNMECIHMLMEHRPEGIKTLNVQGMTPEYIAFRNNRTNAERLLAGKHKEVIKAIPELDSLPSVYKHGGGVYKDEEFRSASSTDQEALQPVDIGKFFLIPRKTASGEKKKSIEKLNAKNRNPETSFWW